MHERLSPAVGPTADLAHEGIRGDVRSHVLEEQTAASENQMAVRARQGGRRVHLLHVPAEAAEGGVDAATVRFAGLTAGTNRTAKDAVLAVLKGEECRAR